MTEDIHQWVDGRYTLMFDEHTFFVFDNENEKRMTALQVTEKLNEQHDELKLLRATNREQYEQIQRFQEEEKLYAQEILRLNNLLKQYQSNLDLGGDY